ncbi:histamine H2 receptor-like [Ptychodera flava]|uniref:histamine H2 receptor-like n=1 Tax=Ptychodera flava TaxID=63121 RepID=UPI003969D070
MNTTVGKRDIDLTLIVTQAMTIFVIAVLIIIANVLNIIVFSKNDKILPIGGRCFAISLASADLVMGFLFFTSLVGCVTQEPLIDSVSPLCAVLGSLYHTAVTASTMSLMLLAVDRFLAVQWPLHYPAMMTMKRAVAMALVGWIFLASYSIFLIFANGNDFYAYHAPAYICIPIYAGHKLVILTAIMCKMIPFGVIIVIYVRILVIARHQLRRINTQVTHGRGHGRGTGTGAADASSLKAVKMFFAVTTAFSVSWTPYGALILYYLIGDTTSEHVAGWILLLASYFVASNSFWNFIIYSAMNSSFRRAAFLLVKKTLCCTHSKRSPVKKISINTNSVVDNSASS